MTEPARGFAHSTCPPRDAILDAMTVDVSTFSYPVEFFISAAMHHFFVLGNDNQRR